MNIIVFQMISAATTYFVILVQFERSSEHYQEK